MCFCHLSSLNEPFVVWGVTKKWPWKCRELYEASSVLFRFNHSISCIFNMMYMCLGGADEKESTSIDQILGSLSQEEKGPDRKGIQLNGDTFLDKDGNSHSGPVCYSILCVWYVVVICTSCYHVFPVPFPFHFNIWTDFCPSFQIEFAHSSWAMLCDQNQNK